MKKYYFFLFLCLLTFYVIEAQELKWQTTSINTNTDNQRFDDVFFLNENLGWAANGYHAAVYKTTDGGLNWTEQVNETVLGEDLYFRNIEFLPSRKYEKLHLQNRKNVAHQNLFFSR